MNERSLAEQWGLVIYGVITGICACVFGAWVSSGISGGAAIGLWICVSFGLAFASAWYAERAVSLLGRLIRRGRDRFLAVR